MSSSKTENFAIGGGSIVHINGQDSKPQRIRVTSVPQAVAARKAYQGFRLKEGEALRYKKPGEKLISFKPDDVISVE